jgi:hypothetical protein
MFLAHAQIRLDIIFKLHSLAWRHIESRGRADKDLGTRCSTVSEINLETRARNPLWRLAEALGNTGDFCTKISTFGSSTPLDIYK